jgi:hypothetical protein
MKRSEILNVIKEEIEVVLTNHEMIEFFDIDPVRLLDEMMIAEAEEGEEGLDVGQLGKERETRSAAKKRYRELGKTGGDQDITPKESGILKQIAGVLTQVAKTDDLMKYRPLIRPLLKKLQQRSQKSATQKPTADVGGDVGTLEEEGEDKSFSKAAKEIEKKGTEGVFTAKAKKAGMGVQAYADKVLAKDSKASTKTKRQAAFAKGAATVARENK